MSIYCEILLKNNDNVFYSGQLLCGIVHLTLTEESTVRRISVRIFGRSYVYWRKFGYRPKQYRGNEVYLDRKEFLFDDQNGNNFQYSIMIINL